MTKNVFMNVLNEIAMQEQIVTKKRHMNNVKRDSGKEIVSKKAGVSLNADIRIKDFGYPTSIVLNIAQN